MRYLGAVLYGIISERYDTQVLDFLVDNGTDTVPIIEEVVQPFIER